jgi:ABC-type multidrug transport system ATPase subunit
VVDRFGLAPLARRRVGSLSRGERQRFALAQAAVGAPALQVLDEPEQGLDVAGRATLAAWVRERRAEGATILLSTHDLDLAADLGDRALILDAGRRIATLTAEGAERRPVGYRVTLAAPHPALSEIVEATRSDEATGSPGGVRAGDGGGPGPERESGSALPAIDRALLPIDDEHALALCLARLIDAGARPILVEPAASRWQTRLAAALAPDSEEAPAAARGP